MYTITLLGHPSPYGSGLTGKALVAVWHLLSIDLLEAARLQFHFGIHAVPVVLTKQLLALVTLALHHPCCARGCRKKQAASSVRLSLNLFALEQASCQQPVYNQRACLQAATFLR